MTVAPVVRHVLSSAVAPADSGPFDARGVGDAVAHLRGARLTTLALAAADPGDLLLTSRQEDDLADAQASIAAMILEVDALTLAALADLGADELIVLKGLAHAHLDHADPSAREYGDLDLYVSAGRLAEVERWFARRGFARGYADFAPGWAVEFGKSITLRGEHLEVDLHRNLSQGLGLGVRPPCLFAHRTTFDLAGVTVPALDAEARLVHAALHAMGGSATPPINGLFDLAVMARDTDRLRRALRLAGEWDLALTLANAVRSAAAACHGLDEAVGIVDGVAGSRNERVRRRVLADQHHPFRNDVVAGALSLRGLRPRVRFVRSLVSSRL